MYRLFWSGTNKPNDEISDTVAVSSSDNDTIVIKPLNGTSTLSEERSMLMDTAILTEIERMNTGTPQADEYGNYLTDQYGYIIFESNCDVDYTEMENNLCVIINYFADRGYSNEAIRQIQRYYYHYARSFAKYETSNILEKIALCFPANGTTPHDLTEKAEEIFGQIREDGFPFVFESPVAVADIKIVFCNVKAWSNLELSAEKEHLCLYDVLYSGNENERNLEGWLHKIINEMSAMGHGEKELIIAQLLYAGSLAESEYRHDLVNEISSSVTTEPFSVESLKTSIHASFNVNIEDNLALMNYLEGVTAYEKR